MWGFFTLVSPSLSSMSFLKQGHCAVMYVGHEQPMNNYEKRVAKALKELHRIIDSLEPML